MGLDLTIYKENNKGKRREVGYFCSDGWSIVTYFATKLNNKDLSDVEIPITMTDIRDLIERCKKVLTAYYSRSFDNPDSWVDVAVEAFNAYDEDYLDSYDDNYIDDIISIYRDLWAIQAYEDDDTKFIVDISY